MTQLQKTQRSQGWIGFPSTENSQHLNNLWISWKKAESSYEHIISSIIKSIVSLNGLCPHRNMYTSFMFNI